MKKKGLLWLPVLVALHASLVAGLALASGYLSAWLASGKKEGERRRPFRSLAFSIHRWQFHLHHWVWATSLLLSNWFLSWHFPRMLTAFLGGVAVHGLASYRDWHHIFWRHRDDN